MQEAILSQQFLRRQATKGERFTEVASDAVLGEAWGVSRVVDEALKESGYFPTASFPDFSGDLPLAVSGARMIGIGGSFSQAFDIPSVGGRREPVVTSDRLEDGSYAKSRKEQAEIYSRLEEAKAKLPRQTYNQVKQRFAFLFEPEDGERVSISLGSVRQFLRLLRMDSKLHCPSIVVTDRGNAKAIWQASDSQIFWIEFEPNGDVIYLAFFPNEKRSDGIERVSALSTIDDVLERAEETGAIKWMRRP